MHDTAYDLGKKFFQVYWKQQFSKILELGSMNVNGTLRDIAPPGASYLGVDAEAGPGVDVVVAPDTQMEFSDGSFDVALASSVFEHDDFFWETFIELVRLTRSGGYVDLNVPSNGLIHRYPSDNWRFYPDSGRALTRWATRRGYAVTLIESFTANRKADVWNDFVAVFGVGDAACPPDHMFDVSTCRNVHWVGEDEMLSVTDQSEDMELISELRSTVLEERQRKVSEVSTGGVEEAAA